MTRGTTRHRSRPQVARVARTVGRDGATLLPRSPGPARVLPSGALIITGSPALTSGCRLASDATLTVRAVELAHGTGPVAGSPRVACSLVTPRGRRLEQPRHRKTGRRARHRARRVR